MVMIHLQRGNWWMGDHTNERSICRWRIAAWKASGASPLTDDLVGSAMVLARGISDTVGGKAKALGWNQELWREKAAGV
jgi:hypothetical protein